MRSIIGPTQRSYQNRGMQVGEHEMRYEYRIDYGDGRSRAELSDA